VGYAGSIEDGKSKHTRIKPNYSSNESDKKIYNITEDSTGESFKKPNMRNIKSMEGETKSLHKKMISFNSEAPSDYSDSGIYKKYKYYNFSSSKIVGDNDI
jgi:hypothetical protein